jgi:glycosyltransferase involved in cell wall biosynthesis
MTTDAVGGVWTYCLDLVDALAELDVRVDLAVVGPPPDEARRDALRASRVESVHEVPGALEWMPDPWSEVDDAGRTLLALSDQLEPDVVHLNQYAVAALDWQVPTVVVAHSDVCSWWRAVHRAPAPPAWREYAHRVGAGLRAAGAVVAPSAAVAADLHREYELDGARVVHNGRSAHWVRTAPKEPIVFSMGRLWDEAKNVRALDRVAEELPWPVVVAGDGEPVHGRGAQFVGSLDPRQVATWLARAAVFAAPVRYEPFGLAALEAALSGCALVLGDLPSLREVWHDAAVFVAPDDEDELRRVLLALIAEPEQCLERGRIARARARRYGPARMAAAYADLYRSCLDRSCLDRSSVPTVADATVGGP